MTHLTHINPQYLKVDFCSEEYWKLSLDERNDYTAYRDEQRRQAELSKTQEQRLAEAVSQYTSVKKSLESYSEKDALIYCGSVAMFKSVLVDYVAIMERKITKMRLGIFAED